MRRRNNNKGKLNFIDHADTSYWFIFFIIVMYPVMIALSYLGSFILKWLENKIQGRILQPSRKE